MTISGIENRFHILLIKYQDNELDRNYIPENGVDKVHDEPQNICPNFRILFHASEGFQSTTQNHAHGTHIRILF